MKNFLFNPFQFMPYLTGASCTTECGEPDFPQIGATCVCEQAVGGINELYFIPCTKVFSAANIVSLSWWTEMLGDPAATPEAPPTLGRSGLGLGSIGKKSDKRDRIGSCRTEQLTSVTWALKFIIKCFDKTNARVSQAMMNELIKRFDKYLLAARMCDGENEVLPVGIFNTSDFNWVVPDNFEDHQHLELELSWKELGMPSPVTVPGLSTVLPKLA